MMIKWKAKLNNNYNSSLFANVTWTSGFDQSLRRSREREKGEREDHSLTHTRFDLETASHKNTHMHILLMKKLAQNVLFTSPQYKSSGLLF